MNCVKSVEYSFVPSGSFCGSLGYMVEVKEGGKASIHDALKKIVDHSGGIENPAKLVHFQGDLGASTEAEVFTMMTILRDRNFFVIALSLEPLLLKWSNLVQWGVTEVNESRECQLPTNEIRLVPKKRIKEPDLPQKYNSLYIVPGNLSQKALMGFIKKSNRPWRIIPSMDIEEKESLI